MIMNAQIVELRAIRDDMNRTGDPLELVMQRRPPWIGWVDEKGNVRSSPRLALTADCDPDGGTCKDCP